MYSSLLHFIAVNHLVLGAYSVAVLGVCLFLRGLQLFARKRVRGRVPTISVSAATAGLGTISGAASGPRTLIAPITGKECYVYRASIWQRESGSQEWKNVAEETGHLTFLVEDPTGKLSVEPGEADLDLRQCFSEEYASASHSNSTLNQPDIPAHVGRFLIRNGVALDRPTRIEECCLQLAAPVFVTGTLVENLNGQSAKRDGSPVIERANRNAQRNQSDSKNTNLPSLVPAPEVIRLTSGTAPSTTLQMTQQAKIAAALSRAGLAKTDVWTPENSTPNLSSVVVRGKAQSDPGLAARVVASAYDSSANTSQRDDSSPDWTPPTRFSMMKGSEGSTFVISNHGPVHSMALGWESIALVIAGSNLSAFAIGEILLGHLRWVR